MMVDDGNDDEQQDQDDDQQQPDGTAVEQAHVIVKSRSDPVRVRWIGYGSTI
jgi:hypothetical protein